MRLVCALAWSLVAGCATSLAPSDAGVAVEMGGGQCDRQQLFSACSAQCNFQVCVVAAASCQGTQWVCDCSQVGPCVTHD